MNDDSATEFFCALAIPEEWVSRVNEAPGEGTKIELVAYLNVGRRDAHLGMEMPDDKREVPTVLGRYFLDYDALQTGRVFMTMPEEDVSHSDGGMP